jgi:2-dehydropantoate 2-reductase
MTMRVAVLGAGSLGTILGAMLARDGLNVELVDANRDHVEALTSHGARVEGLMEFETPVKALMPDLMEGYYDLVVYMAKSTYDEAALPQVLPHLEPRGALITLQNGVPEEKVASLIGRERTLGGAVGWAAEYLRPGVSALRSDPDKMTYDIGELDGELTARIIEAKEILDHAGIASVTTNLTGIRWTKLLINAAASGISTVLGGTGGEVMGDDRAIDAVICIMIETIRTAQALGIKMEPIQGVDPTILLDIAREDMGNARNVLRMVTSSLSDAKASMLQDLEKGIPCEVEAINGHLYRASREVGVPAPVNDQVTAMIRNIQDGKMSFGFSNLDKLDLPDITFYFADT